MKWLPPPSVPRWERWFDFSIFGVPGTELTKARRERFPGRRDGSGWIAPRAAVTGSSAIRASVRNRGLDRAPHLCQVFRQVRSEEVRPSRDHAAAEVHADGGGHDGANSGNYTADRGSDPEVNVGHHGNVVVNERKTCGITELRERGVFERHAVRPKLDRYCARFLDRLHSVDRLLNCQRSRLCQ